MEPRNVLIYAFITSKSNAPGQSRDDRAWVLASASACLFSLSLSSLFLLLAESSYYILLSLDGWVPASEDTACKVIDMQYGHFGGNVICYGELLFHFATLIPLVWRNPQVCFGAGLRYKGTYTHTHTHRDTLNTPSVQWICVNRCPLRVLW